MFVDEKNISITKHNWKITFVKPSVSIHHYFFTAKRLKSFVKCMVQTIRFIHSHSMIKLHLLHAGKLMEYFISYKKKKQGSISIAVDYVSNRRFGIEFEKRHGSTVMLKTQPNPNTRWTPLQNSNTHKLSISISRKIWLRWNQKQWPTTRTERRIRWSETEHVLADW